MTILASRSGISSETAHSELDRFAQRFTAVSDGRERLSGGCRDILASKPGISHTQAEGDFGRLAQRYHQVS